MISAVVLTNNNENIIQRTLKSLSWCDEVHVIDDFSDDKTVNICKQSGAIVHQHALQNNFSAARNLGLKKAKGEWVLFVDSDEVVDKTLADEIQHVVKKKECEDVQGYYMKRNDCFLGKWLRYGETRQIALLRLGRKKSGKWEGVVHERWNVKGKTAVLQHPLKHYPHPNVAQFLDEIQLYTTLRAKELYQKKIRVRPFDIFVYPVAKFCLNYFFRFGFLDGVQGTLMAILMSFHSFLVRAKLWHLYSSRT